MQTATQTKSKVSTATKVAVGLAAVAAAAYAGVGAFASKGYQNFSVACHSGATMSWNQNSIRIQTDPKSPVEVYKPGNPCASAQTLESIAERFCGSGSSKVSGKSGINNYKVSHRCEIPQPSVNYGYNNPASYGYSSGQYGYVGSGYGYGYANPNTGYGYAGNGYGYSNPNTGYGYAGSGYGYANPNPGYGYAGSGYGYDIKR